MRLRSLRCVLSLSLLSLLPALPAHAGGWVQEKGDTLFINQLTYFTSNHYYDRSGNTQKEPSFSKLEYQPYLEYGLDEAYTIGGDAYLQRAWQNGSNNTGIADPEIFLRARLYHDNNQVFSLQPLVKLPSLYEDNSRTPRGGSRSTDTELSLLYGRNLHWLSDRDYLDTRLGYRVRNRGLNNQTKADLAIGLSPAANWQVIPALRYVRADSLGNSATFTENGEMDYDLLKAELGVAYQLTPKDWVQLTVFDHLAGRQTGSGDGVTVAYGVHF